jgi:hypothetical protein
MFYIFSCLRINFGNITKKMEREPWWWKVQWKRFTEHRHNVWDILSGLVSFTDSSIFMYGLVGRYE